MNSRGGESSSSTARPRSYCSSVHYLSMLLLYYSSAPSKPASHPPPSNPRCGSGGVAAARVEGRRLVVAGLSVVCLPAQLEGHSFSLQLAAPSVPLYVGRSNEGRQADAAAGPTTRPLHIITISPPYVEGSPLLPPASSLNQKLTPDTLYIHALRAPPPPNPPPSPSTSSRLPHSTRVRSQGGGEGGPLHIQSLYGHTQNGKGGGDAGGGGACSSPSLPPLPPHLRDGRACWLSARLPSVTDPAPPPPMADEPSWSTQLLSPAMEGEGWVGICHHMCDVF